MSSVTDEIKQQGYSILRNAISAEEIQSTAEFIDQLIDELDVNYSKESDALTPWYLPHRLDNGVLYDVYQRHPALRARAHTAAIIESLNEYFGHDFYLYVNSLLYKPPGQQNDVPWHQDFLSRPSESEKILAWIAIDKASTKNGCLRVIPGSHKKGLRQWYRVEGETHHDRIKLEDDEELKAIDVELNPGDILLFSQYLIHSSQQNNSNSRRKALRFVYKSSQDGLQIPRAIPIVMSDLKSSIKSTENRVANQSMKTRVVKKLIQSLERFV